ncbi:hypothetical protein [Marininema halotolerans]|uniref:Uncharacterized protein n=1 Tax=Marininema halotolerans TaxID=1155944 RepID=A0A1I6Q4Q6_9BACL|nr:hypothetical protein [Marininema halotolerans]SFS47374.1 hypothetical protein SAMN05444972_102338 [Marininema halotolerans]
MKRLEAQHYEVIKYLALPMKGGKSITEIAKMWSVRAARQYTND